MKEISVAILDEDSVYAERLSRYLLLKARAPFSVQVFTDPVRAREGLSNKEPQILLVSPDWMEEAFLSRESGDQTFLLMEEEQAENPWNCPGLYRYQSGEALSGQLAEAALRQQSGRSACKAGLKEGIVGVYSPVGRCGKTAFSLALGMSLARRGKVLFWSLDRPSGWQGLRGRNGTEAEELFYCYRQGKGLFQPFSERKLSLYGMEAVPVTEHPSALREVAEEEVAALGEALRQACACRWLVLDVGNFFCAPEQILKRCCQVYMPILEDGPSRGKAARCEAIPAERLALPKAEPEETDQEGIGRLRWGSLGLLAEKKAKELCDELTETTEEPGAFSAGSGAGAGR